MTLLSLGLLMWVAAHTFKRLLPTQRQMLQDKMGDASKGLFAVVIVVSVLAMIFGYRGAEFVEVYTPPAWGVHLNNLAMIAAIALFGMGKSKGRARAWLRHPMLMGVLVWGLAHLLVNGDMASMILFGGLAAWSVGNMVLINYREGAWTRPEPGPVSGDLRLLAITLVLYGIIAGLHMWLGPWPFPG
ncbi:MAG: NnrU family protein [Pseudomonadota bacterium]